MLYLIQVTMYTGVLWLLYMLLLRNRPIHAFNRAYLLAAALLPIVLPLLKLPETIPQRVGYSTQAFNMPEFVVGDQVAANAGNEQTIAWTMILYAVIASIALFIVLLKYIQLRRVIKRSPATEHNGYTLLQNTGYGPGSWGRYIFLPDAEVNDLIIKHEAAHVQLHHSADIMLLSILKAVLWPNVFLYAITKELKQVHEFQADKATGADTDAYSCLLVGSVFNTCTLPFAHSFIIHPIKRRIMMLNKKRSRSSLAMGIIAIAAAGALSLNIVMLQSCKPKPAEPATVTQYDQPASFNGDLYDFLAKNIVYPKAAIDKNIEGRVSVKFIIDESGKITQPKVMGTPDPLLAAAALEVVGKMPAWIPATKNGKPVAMEFFLPVTFRLSDVKMAKKKTYKQVFEQMQEEGLLVSVKDNNNKPAHFVALGTYAVNGNPVAIQTLANIQDARSQELF